MLKFVAFIELIELWWARQGWRTRLATVGVVLLGVLEFLYGDAPFVQDMKEEYVWSLFEEEPECSLEWFKSISSLEEKISEFVQCRSRAGEDVRELLVDEAMESDSPILVTRLAWYLDPNTIIPTASEGESGVPDILAAVQLYGRALDLRASGVERSLVSACNVLNRNDFLHERLFKARCDLFGVNIWRHLDEISAEIAEHTEYSALRSMVLGEVLEWSNVDNRGGAASGSVIILRDGTSDDGSACREYSHKVVVAGKTDFMRNTACLNANGHWTIESSNKSPPGFTSEQTRSTGEVTLNQGENCAYTSSVAELSYKAQHAVWFGCHEETIGAMDFGIVCVQYAHEFRSREVGSSVRGFFFSGAGFRIPEVIAEESTEDDVITVYLHLGNEVLELQGEFLRDISGPTGELIRLENNPDEVFVAHYEHGWMKDWSEREEFADRPLAESSIYFGGPGDSVVLRLAKAIAGRATVQWKVHGFTGMMMPGPKDSEAARNFAVGCDAVRTERLSLDALVQ